MACKSIILLSLLFLTATLRRSACKSLQRICQTHEDCGRVLQICDKGFCRGLKSIAEMGEVLTVKKCSNFKSACSTDQHCQCSHISMICESNECVVRTNSNTSDR